MKVANNNGAGPFGGTVAFQIAGAGATAPAANTANTANTAKAAKGAKNKVARQFQG